MVARCAHAGAACYPHNHTSNSSFFIYPSLGILQLMTTKSTPSTQPDSPLAIISLILGALSFTGPGLFLGIPAVILGIIALKKQLPGRNISIIGLVLGAVSTLLSFILFALFLLLVVFAAQYDDTQVPEHAQPRDRHTFESTRT